METRRIIICVCLMALVSCMAARTLSTESNDRFCCIEDDSVKTESNSNSTYDGMTVDVLESMIKDYEERINKKRNGLKEEVRCLYTGNDHELSIVNLMDVMEEVGISNQLFVLAQAIIETGHFRSRVCKEDHNLFGLTNPRTGKYYRFSRWEDSVVGYKRYVQYKYKGGNYLSFLKRIGYAEAPNYTRTVAKMVRQLYRQLYTEGTVVSIVNR